jgi:hypothetical protein
VINAQTGEIREIPEPKRQKRMHLASCMEETYTPSVKPSLASWSHEHFEGKGPLR